MTSSTVKEHIPGLMVARVKEEARLKAIKDSELQAQIQFFADCKFGNRDNVKLALTKFSHLSVQFVNTSDQSGNHPIHATSDGGFLDILRLILDAVKDINIRDRLGNSPLMRAVISSQFSTAFVLLDWGADARVKNNQSKDILDLVSQQCSSKDKSALFDKLLASGVFTSAADKFRLRVLGGVPQDLHELASEGLIDQLQSCLKSQSPVRVNELSPDGSGSTVLMCAVRGNSIDAVDMLLKKGANVLLQDRLGNTALHVVNKDTSSAIVSALVKANASLVNMQNSAGATALQLSSASSNFDLVVALADSGADIHIVDSKHRTALHYACVSNDTKIALFLISRGISIHELSDTGQTAFSLIKNSACLQRVKEASDIHSMALQGKTQELQHLLRVTPVRVGELEVGTGNNLLMCASLGGHDDIIEKNLLKSKLDINALNKNQESCLMLACKNNHKLTMRLLLQHGANILQRDIMGNSLLHIASEAGYLNTVEVIHSTQNSLLNLQNKFGSTALHLACAKAHTSVATKLVEFGINIQLTDSTLCTALHCACASESIDIAFLLISKGANIFVKSQSGKTAFNMTKSHQILQKLKDATNIHQMALEGKQFELERMLSVAPDRLSELEDDSGNNLLMCACKGGHDNIVTSLLRMQLDVNLVDRNSDTSLTIAVLANKTSTVSVLIRNGVNIRHKTANGDTALHIASKQGNSAIIELLVAADDTLKNDTDLSGRSGLHIASSIGHLNAVMTLVELNADLDTTETKGNTALHLACENEQFDVADYLVTKGCNLNALNVANKTPLNLIPSKQGQKMARKQQLMDLFDVHLQAHNNNISLLFTLLKAQPARLHELDDNKFTVLHFACKFGHFKTALELVLLGGDLHQKNVSTGWLGRHRTPLEYIADKKEQKELLDAAAVFQSLKNSKSQTVSVSVAVQPSVEAPKSPTKQAGTSARLIDWSEIVPDASQIVKIGKGSFGVVFSCQLKTRLGVERVAVKLFTELNEHDNDSDAETIDKLKKKAWEEAEMISFVGRISHIDSFIRVYGVAEGILPPRLASCLKLYEGAQAIGIVMRLESGGSLDKQLRPAQGCRTLTKMERYRLLVEISRALAELHILGIVHGDLKPNNILLSDKLSVRIADFGQSERREQLAATTRGLTTMMKTGRRGGTAIYNAPERFEDVDGNIVKASRKTDMYSFSILTWEVLCEQGTVPFSHIRSDVMLANRLNQGERLDLSELPLETPPAVLTMIQACWSGDRRSRKTAVECYSILNHAYELMRLDIWDIFFSHAWVNKPFLQHIYRLLTQSGFRVWLDQNEMGYDLQNSMRAGIANSKAVVVCASREYQSRPNCLFELEEAKKMGKLVIILVIDENIFSWASDDFKAKCDIKTKKFVGDENVNGVYSGVSSLTTAAAWDEEETSGGPTKEHFDRLRFVFNLYV